MTTPLEALGLLELRVGRVLRAEPNEPAHRPAWKLWIDFGEAGVRQSSAQITALYDADALVDRLVVAAVNLGDRRIAGFRSKALVLGTDDEEGRIVLLAPERDVPPGARVH